MTPTEAAELRAENARLRTFAQLVERGLLAKAIRSQPIMSGLGGAEMKVTTLLEECRAALTPRPPRADAAPAGWDTGENVR